MAPVAIQVVLQSSIMSIIDQIMIGQLGSASISGIGIANTFSGIYFSILKGISTIAAVLLSLFFAFICYLFPTRVAGIIQLFQRH